ncbi:MAG: hypothetical protein O3B26_07345 [Proteobacteria bacterium]|nr:hypothetical protein [Pseudomonadota bacterium]
MDWIGLEWIGLDWIGLDWIGLDLIELSVASRQQETGLAWRLIKQHFVEEIIESVSLIRLPCQQSQQSTR